MARVNCYIRRSRHGRRQNNCQERNGKLGETGCSLLPRTRCAEDTEQVNSLNVCLPFIRNLFSVNVLVILAAAIWIRDIFLINSPRTPEFIVPDAAVVLLCRFSSTQQLYTCPRYMPLNELCQVESIAYIARTLKITRDSTTWIWHTLRHSHHIPFWGKTSRKLLVFVWQRVWLCTTARETTMRAFLSPTSSIWDKQHRLKMIDWS